VLFISDECFVGLLFVCFAFSEIALGRVGFMVVLVVLFFAGFCCCLVWCLYTLVLCKILEVIIYKTPCLV